VGFLADRLSDVAENANAAAMNISGYAGKYSEDWDKFYSGLDKSTQDNLQKLSGVFNQWFDVLIAVVAGKLALAGAGKLGKMAGLGSAGEMMGAAGKTFGIAAAIVMGKELGDLLFDQFIPQFQKYAHEQFGWGGKDGTETTHGGNVIKDSWVDKALTFLHDNAMAATKNMPTSGYPPLLNNSPLPVSPQKMQFSFAPLKIEVTNNGKLDVTMPDGTIQRVALDAVNQQHEVQMMSAQGLQGSWQGTGQNAGFTPSLLTR
jgi:hypothetical protein